MTDDQSESGASETSSEQTQQTTSSASSHVSEHEQPPRQERERQPPPCADCGRRVQISIPCTECKKMRCPACDKTWHARPENSQHKTRLECKLPVSLKDRHDDTQLPSGPTTGTSVSQQGTSSPTVEMSDSESSSSSSSDSSDTEVEPMDTDKKIDASLLQVSPATETTSSACPPDDPIAEEMDRTPTPHELTPEEIADDDFEYPRDEDLELALEALTASALRDPLLERVAIVDSDDELNDEHEGYRDNCLDENEKRVQDAIAERSDILIPTPRGSPEERGQRVVHMREAVLGGDTLPTLEVPPLDEELTSLVTLGPAMAAGLKGSSLEVLNVQPITPTQVENYGNRLANLVNKDGPINPFVMHDREFIVSMCFVALRRTTGVPPEYTHGAVHQAVRPLDL